LFGLITANLLSGCAFPDLQNYEGLEISDSEIAIIKNRWGVCPFCIDAIYDLRDEGIELERVVTVPPGEADLYSSRRDGGIETFKLLPGKYHISAHYQAHNIEVVFLETKVVLQKGHVYAVKEDTCYGWYFSSCRPYTAKIWFEDLSTGKVLAGHKW
jgi:hypothetical protein